MKNNKYLQNSNIGISLRVVFKILTENKAHKRVNIQNMLRMRLQKSKNIVSSYGGKNLKSLKISEIIIIIGTTQ